MWGLCDKKDVAQLMRNNQQLSTGKKKLHNQWIYEEINLLNVMEFPE